VVDGSELHVSASMGLALWTGPASVEDLVRNADLAMYAAKATGKASIRIFESSMDGQVLERLDPTGALRAALATQRRSSAAGRA
jgi:predicted signal transduction protein with EAL and GGDEF domain